MGLLEANDEESMFRQLAVYWAPSKPDSHGQPTWALPVQLSCRWEDEAAEALSPTDEVLTAAAKVYVSQDVVEGGALLLGSLSSTMGTNPRPFGGREIIRVTKEPDREGDDFLRTAYLARS